MLIIYNEMEGDVLHLTTAFSFEDNSDKAEVTAFEGDLFKVEENAYYLKGKAAVIYSTICDRCGGPAEININVDISINIEPEGLFDDRHEHEMNDEDGEIFFSGADSLDLHELLRQEIILQFPVKRLCREDCEGLNEYSTESDVEKTTLNSLAALEILQKKDALKEK